MVPGLPKCAKKACLKQFFTVAKQQDDLGPQNLLKSFFGLIVSSRPFLSLMLTRDGTRPTEMSNSGLFEGVLHSSNATR